MRRMLITALPTVITVQPSLATDAAEEIKMNIMKQEIFDAIHSLILLKEEKDIAVFLENRIQQIDKLERSEFNPSFYDVIFKNIWHPFVRFEYSLSDNRKLEGASLSFQKISFGEVRKVFSGICFGFIDNMYSLAFVKKLPQGTLWFSVGTSDVLSSDDYAELDVGEGIIPEEKLSKLLVDGAGMRYGQVLKRKDFVKEE